MRLDEKPFAGASASAVPSHVVMVAIGACPGAVSSFIYATTIFHVPSVVLVGRKTNAMPSAAARNSSRFDPRRTRRAPPPSSRSKRTPKRLLLTATTTLHTARNLRRLDFIRARRLQSVVRRASAADNLIDGGTTRAASSKRCWDQSTNPRDGAPAWRRFSLFIGRARRHARRHQNPPWCLRTALCSAC